MGLSRLENFLRSTKNNVIFVDVNSLDSTDSVENTGGSPLKPFKNLQRGLIEAARATYVRGLNNDRFDKTTIVLAPGEYYVDNRPGRIVTGTTTTSERSGATNLTDLRPWDLSSNFDIFDPANDLYKLNSIYGGIICGRGISIVASDLRRTKIRPLYVPNPTNDNIERSCIFRVTGGSYFWQFSVFDADPNGFCYKDYTTNKFVPNFSHHKLSVFEYADGVNPININDDFLTYSTTRTDLEMYYEKVARVYGPASSRDITPDYNEGVVDIQPVTGEYQIVGPKGITVGISTIKSGDGVTSSNEITVDLIVPIPGLNVDTAVQISGVGASGYDGQFVVSETANNTQFKYKVSNPPINPAPNALGSTASLVVDTVTSASPYVFNVSLRSVYGMCGLLADGNKASGFKSMVVAQFTGIGLQKDDDAFVKYNTSTGVYEDSASVPNLHTDSRARFKPSYENFHIKATNDAFLQLVSVFAIGYAQQFITENGGDLAINSSNSNFGSKALVSSGFKSQAFLQDDYGYVTHIISPKEIESKEFNIDFDQIDVGLTTSKSVGAAITSRLYLYDKTDINNPPTSFIDGYNIGSRTNELLYLQGDSSRIVMPSGPYNSTEYSSEKSFRVGRSSVGINSIANNTITLTQNHSFINGEKVRIFAENGHLPDGVLPDTLYYAITRETATGISSSQIRLAQSLNGAINGAVLGNAINLNNRGGSLRIVSRVSDKIPGEIGHPIQYDDNWYVGVSTVNNGIYDTIRTQGVAGLGDATSRTYVKRKSNSRTLNESLYKVRYVIPKNSSTLARPPVEGFIIQESGNIIGAGTTEISQLHNPSGVLLDSNSLRNPRFIANASWATNTVTIRTETPHHLKTGEEVEIVNITPIAYNGTYKVASVLDAKRFTYTLNSNPGTFTNNTSSRTEALPYFKCKKLDKTYQVYRAAEVQPYVANVQDGVYDLIVIHHSVTPTVAPFTENSFSQPVANLYPQINLDNLNSDPKSTICFASPNSIGEVLVNDAQNSLTKETIENLTVGIGITAIASASSGIAHTIYTELDHGLAGITSVSIITPGFAYGNGSSGTFFNAQLVGFAGSTTGSNATARITIDGAGQLTGVTIIDGGSAYGIGNTLSVVGIATTTAFVSGVVRVEAITDNINDSILISGITSTSVETYNNSYRISSIAVGQPKELNVISAQGISTTGLSQAAKLYVTGKSIGISTLTYNNITGIATVGFSTNHGYNVNDKITIGGANETSFNGGFVIKRINNASSVSINVGTGLTFTSISGTPFVYRPLLNSSGGNSRINYQYAGITTTISSTILSTAADGSTITIPNAYNLGFKLGDYLLIDDEIFRISNAVTSNTITIFRALLGTIRATHTSGTVVRRIYVAPLETRRNSIIRASGHTFEYLGYGPGNYSTALPEKQNRSLTPNEKFLSQSTKDSGGLIVYTGMNNDGDFFTGNKKINSATGKEETFDTPIPSFSNEKEKETSINVTETQKLYVNRYLKVEGSESVAEFNGPAVFRDKVTSLSPKGIEASAILLQSENEVARRYTIGTSIPAIAGNLGDIQYNANPTSGDNIGWVYTSNNSWETFGKIGLSTENSIEIYRNSSLLGQANRIDFVGDGVASASYNSVTGISTLVFNAPSFNVLTNGSSVGISTQINFVGTNLSVSGSFNSLTNTSTINVVGLGSTDVLRATQFIKTNPTGATNYLKVDGTDTAISYNDVVNGLGFVPANVGSVSGGSFPQGNSVVLDSFELVANNGPFDGVKTDFLMKINEVAYIPPGSPANLIVSLGGIIQKPGADFIIVQSGGNNTSTIRFTVAPPTGISHYAVALGGQGALLSDPSWTGRGQLIVGVSSNVAAIVGVGTDDTVLTADSTVGVGVSWKNIINTTSTAVSKTLANREFCSVTADDITITLPASPRDGFYVSINNTSTFDNITIARNGSLIMGLAEDLTIDISYVTVNLVYVNNAIGWRIK